MSLGITIGLSALAMVFAYLTTRFDTTFKPFQFLFLVFIFGIISGNLLILKDMAETEGLANAANIIEIIYIATIFILLIFVIYTGIQLAKALFDTIGNTFKSRPHKKK